MGFGPHSQGSDQMSVQEPQMFLGPLWGTLLQVAFILALVDRNEKEQLFLRVEKAT